MEKFKKIPFFPVLREMGFLSFVISLALSLALNWSCSKKEKLYTNQEIWDIAAKEDPNIKLLLPDKDLPVVDCSLYGPGCLYGVTAELREMSFLMVRFESAAMAIEAARKFEAYTYHNWIFDDVTGEPILEDFIKKAYQAKKISRTKVSEGQQVGRAEAHGKEKEKDKDKVKSKEKEHSTGH